MRKLYLLVLVTLPLAVVKAQCPAPTGHAYLDVNNVRMRMNTTGSDWWDDVAVAQYEIPAGSGVHCFYTGAFWIGGLDPVDGLHLAAVRFRQVGEDYWPGPLNTDGQIDSATCVDHDRIYKLNRWQVEEFIQRVDESGYVIPEDILEWPAEGNIFTDVNAKAPFIDVNGNGIYEPTFGDYPAFAINEPTDMDFHLLGDQCLWWVQNDMGNLHTETGGEPLGVEIQSMAYAYATCNELNDQTFYRKKVINKSTVDYHDTYTGVWVDADVGYAQDDYVQCHVMKNLGFAYNGFAIDGTGGPYQYGAHPPSAGVCLLEGALADPNDGVDNDRDGELDEQGEHLKMSGFLYHNNTGGNPAQQDPGTAQDYYNYMKGVWKDGLPVCYGGTGHPAGGCDAGLEAAFMFPGDSDPLGYGTGGSPAPLWTEQTAGNVPLDRRFLVSSGPFTLNSGDTTHIHYGALWARDTINADPQASNQALYDVTDVCQEAFDNRFENLDCCPPNAQISLVQAAPNRFFFSSIASGQTYFWDFGDGSTSTERFPMEHQYNDNQVHQVMLVVSNSCGSDTAYLNAGTIFYGVDDIVNDVNVKVHPVPTNGQVTVELRLQQPEKFSLVIRSLEGKEVMRKAYNRKILETNLDLSHCSKGIYMLSLEGNSFREHLRITLIE